MKNLKISLAAMLLLASFFASAQEKDKMDHNKMNMDGMQMGPEFKNKDLTNAYERYAEIKEALVNSNSVEAQKAAKTLGEALGEVDRSDDAKKASNDIAGSNNLESQRKSFSKLGLEMESLLKGNLTSGKIYMDFCPMAIGGNGAYWLSSIEEIQNPYYGSTMLSCGKVTKIIEK